MAKGFGDGSVYQTKDGRWRGKVRLTDPVTKKKQPVKYFYGKSETEVKRQIRAYKSNALNYTGPITAKANAYEYFRKWLDEYKKNEIKVSSYDRLDAVLRLYLKDKFEVMQLGEITPDICNRIINELKDRGLSHSTAKKVYDAMNACFKFAVVRREIPYNPLDSVSMPRKDKFVTKRKDNENARHLTEDEEAAFLAELDRKTGSTGRYVYRYRDAFILDLNTGLRIGELVALNWDDIDFEKKTLRVNKTAVMIKERDKDGEPSGGVKQIIQESPKTSKGVRTVPLNKTALAALERLKEQAGENTCVFPTQTGARLVMPSLEKQYGNIVGHCGIEGTSFHSLRHTFATRLFERKADVKDVSALLGHASVAITYNTYIHVIEERKSDVVSLLEQ